jgi:hypothetical protein
VPILKDHERRCLVLNPTSPSIPHRRGACPDRFLGNWKYRQAAGDGYDAEGERLELSCSGGSLRGLYFGLEREGEGSLFYTLVEVRDLSVGTNGEISFMVPERELYASRPRKLDDLNTKAYPSSGITRDKLHYQGRLAGRKMALSCTAKMATCPDREMVFNRGAATPTTTLPPK